MRFPLPRPVPRRTWLALVSVLALALAVRLPLLPTTAHLYDYYPDTTLWKDWAQQISQHGLARIFDVADINYIGYDYVLWLIAVIYSRISPAFDLQSMRLHLLVKGPPVLFDLALVALTFLVTRSVLQDRPAAVAAARRSVPVLDRLAVPPETALALLPAALVALQPAMVYDSAAWGQTDGIITVFMLGAVLALARKAPTLAFFLWTVGFTVKPQPIVVLPPLVAFAWWTLGWRGLAKGAVGLVTGLALMLGFWVAHGETRSLIHVYHALFTPEPALSMQAWNVWWFTMMRSHPLPGDAVAVVGGFHLTFRWLSMTLFALVMLVGLAYLRRHRDLVGLLEASAFAVFAFYMLPVSIHERYLYPLFGLLAPVVVVRPRWLLLYAPLSVTFFLNLFAVAPVDAGLSGRLTDGPLSLAGAAFHVAAFASLLLVLLYAGLARTKAQRTVAPVM